MGKVVTGLGYNFGLSCDRFGLSCDRSGLFLTSSWRNLIDSTLSGDIKQVTSVHFEISFAEAEESRILFIWSFVSEFLTCSYTAVILFSKRSHSTSSEITSLVRLSWRAKSRFLSASESSGVLYVNQ